jgi:2-hydroxy-3-oxopropionate reductase
MARNLLTAGYPLMVWNRTRAKAEALRADGAQVAGSPAEATRAADVILSCLYDAPSVEQVVAGPGGVLEAIGAGQVFIDHSTNSPPVSQRLAALLEARGAAMLDAPISGGDAGAQAGTLSIMVGGAPAVFERCRPILGAMGSTLTLMGPAVGAGGYAKLANQIMVAVHLVARGEALIFGAKAGLDLPRLVTALRGGMANSVVLERKADNLLRGDFAPGSEANMQLKDLAYIQQAMQALGISLPVANLLRELFQQATDAGLGKLDHSAVVQVLERAAGVQARR